MGSDGAGSCVGNTEVHAGFLEFCLRVSCVYVDVGDDGVVRHGPITSPFFPSAFEALSAKKKNVGAYLLGP